MVEAYGKLPVTFETNQGQNDARVRFLGRVPGLNLFLTQDAAVFDLHATASPTAKGASHDPGKRVVLRMKYAGANPNARLVGVEELPGKTNYLIGSDPKKWRKSIPNYRRVRYQGLYSGVDLEYYGNQRQLEFDFVVSPGGNPKDIQVEFEGADRLELDSRGDLLIHTAVGPIRQPKPHVYQEHGDAQEQISAGYKLIDTHRVAFQLARYDRSRPVIIDPVLVYSTYLGGSGDDYGVGIAVDTAGNAYVVGQTTSANFPTSAGVLDNSYNSNNDTFVTKLNPSGSALVYSTYLGGTGSDEAHAIAVDAAGNAYVTGGTTSLNFPTTSGAFDTSYNGGPYDAFVTKLNPSGSGLVYSTYLGGNGPFREEAYGIAVDTSGNAYVTGYTTSANFPITPGAFSATIHGFADAFVTKLNPTGSSLVYSTYLGGTNRPGSTFGSDDQGLAIAVDASGNAYVTGRTDSTNFPTTPGAFKTTSNDSSPNLYDAFVTKLSPAGALIYSTYLGGSAYDDARGIAVDAAGNAYITGGTLSLDFPTTPGAFDTNCPSCAFITKLNPSGSGLIYSTYLHGSFAFGIAVDTGGNAWVTGWNSRADFPTTVGGFPYSGGQDAFVTKLNSTGTSLVYSTGLGGTADDQGLAIALDPAGNAYVTGYTGFTSPASFPTTAGAFGTSNHGGYDAFVAKFGPSTVSAGGTVTVNEGTLATNSGTFTPGPVTLTASVGTVTITGANSDTWNWSYQTSDGPAQSQTVTITATDGSGDTGSASFVLVVTNIAPVVSSPSVSAEPSSVGDPVTAFAAFSDVAADAPFTCTVNYGDGSGALAGSISGSTCTGPAHVYTNNGAYTVTVSVKDKDGAVGTRSSTHNVTRTTPTITWPAPSAITYGTPLSGTQLNATATVSGGSIAGTFTYTPPAGTVLPAGNGQTLSVTFTPTDTANYNSATAGTSITVNKAIASVTPNAASKTYGTADPAFTGTLTGFLPSDNITAAYSRTAGELVAGSPYTISATLSPTSALSNYTVTNNTAVFTIDRAVASVTPNAGSKTYGTADPAFTGTLNGFLASDNVSAIYTRTGGETVAGSPYAISATLSPAGVLGNYSITTNTANFTISKAAASVTVNAASKIYGTADPAFTGTLAGFLASDGITATYTRTAGESVAGSPYTISVTLSPAGVLGNYDIASNTASFTIDKASASVTPNAAFKTYGAADPPLTGALSGFIPADNVTASYGRTAGESVAGSPYTISATLSPAAALANYNVTSGTASFTINTAAATVTANAASKTYGTPDPALTCSTSGFVAADNVTATATRTPGEGVAGSPYTISCSTGPASVLANYHITDGTAPFTINKANASFSCGNPFKTYGAPDPPLACTPTGFLPSDNITMACTRASGETVAGSPYLISCTISPASALANYSIGGVPQYFTINRVPASVTPNAASKTYGAADPALSGVLSGFLPGDGVTAAYTRTPGETVAGSPYTISATLSPTSVLGNYSITPNTALFTINKAALTVIANNVTRPYLAANPLLTASYSGFVNGDTSSVLSGSPVLSTTALPSSPPGSYAINVAQGTLAAANYTFGPFVPGTLTITAPPLVTDVTAVPSVVQVGSGFTVNATVTGGPVSPQVNLDGGTFAAMILDTSSGLWTASIAPPAVGVHNVCVRAISQGDPVCILVAVYDPDGGFVTGGGWITSPAGAYAANPSLTGKANFGFVSKYQHGATVPSGDTEFQFQAAGLNFKSRSYQWLVVAGARAQFKGSGTINGSGDYDFLLSAIDGQVNGGGGVDKFRIKIWNSGGVVYDNQMGADDTGDPTTVLGGGSIVIHQ